MYTRQITLSNLSLFMELFSIIVTFFAVVVALFLEPIQRFIQKQFPGPSILDNPIQILQGNQFITRFLIRNNGIFRDYIKVYVSKIEDRIDFIDVPLMWTHGYAEGEPIKRTIASKRLEMVDFLTVNNDNGIYSLNLIIGPGSEIEKFRKLNIGKSSLFLRIDSTFGRQVSYNIIIDWNGKYEHPRVVELKKIAGSL